MNSMEILSIVASIATLIGFSLTAWVSFTIWKAKRSLKGKLLSVEGKKELSRHPIAIVIGIGKDPISSVKNYLADGGWGDVPIISYVSDGYLQTRDYLTAMAKINELREQALELGVSEVLLFYAGPNDLATFTGASFSDWVPVKIFSFTNGTYEHKFTLEREATRMNTLKGQLVSALQ